MEKNYSEKKVNLHTHTAHCRHASGLPEDYCAAALEQNFEILGFSDHAPFPDERYHGSRMFFQELKTYRREVEAAKAKFPDLHVLAGLEVEYCPDLGKEYYSDYLLGEVGLDYLIGAAHFVKMPDGTIYPFYSESWGNPEVIQAFFRQTLDTMEHLPIAFLAHPDGFACMVERMTPEVKKGFQEIISLAVERDIPLEINANGVRRGKFKIDGQDRYRYPWEPFWELAAENKAKVVISSDAHHPSHLLLEYNECEELAKRLGLNIVNREVAEKLLESQKQGRGARDIL